jgi:PhzF family phenazine biosynthesis protein
MAKTGVSYACVDVFTNEKFTGNQLAIVQLPKSGLGQEEKQEIAKEFNYSESVFVHAREKDDSSENTNSFTIDIFTTTEELPFAGHPVIGTACYLLGSLAKEEKVVAGTFHTKAGKIGLEYDVASKTAKAAIPHNVHIHNELYERSELERLQPSLGFYPSTSPVVSIVKGMTFVLIPLELLDALTFVNTTPYPVKTNLDEEWGNTFVGSYFYVRLPSHDGSTVRLRTRMIEQSLEDPATGSAACTLAAYLTLQDGKPGQTVKYEIVQGMEMGRRSEIFVEVKLGEGKQIETVHLSGGAVQIMEGKLFL